MEGFGIDPIGHTQPTKDFAHPRMARRGIQTPGTRFLAVQRFGTSYYRFFRCDYDQLRHLRERFFVLSRLRIGWSLSPSHSSFPHAVLPRKPGTKAPQPNSVKS
jgi:hypothetical protein